MFIAVLNVVLPCGISGSHSGEYEDFNENTRRYIPEGYHLLCSSVTEIVGNLRSYSKL
jgi:hypothetical protein